MGQSNEIENTKRMIKGFVPHVIGPRSYLEDSGLSDEDLLVVENWSYV